MILYSVKCSHGHQFDEWFRNSSDYEEKAQAHEIVCPTCQDRDVVKAIMAPSVAKSSSPAPMAPSCQSECGCKCAFAGGF